MVDQNSGDILIGDFRSRKTVLRFSGDGKFLYNYGRVSGQGPGEYNELMGFTSMEDGSVVIQSNMKLIKYSKDGTLQREIRNPHFAENIVSIGNFIYVPVLRYRKVPEKKNAVVVFDSQLEKKGGFGDYDNRLEKFLYTFPNSVACQESRLIYIDHYDLNINIFDTETKNMKRLSVPNDNSLLDVVWAKKRIDDAADKRISSQLHRFDNIFAFQDRLLLFEYCRGKEIWNAWLMNLRKKELFVFDCTGIYGDPKLKVPKDLYFDRIPGSYNRGIIGVFSDAESFKNHKSNFPLLKNESFEIDENPIIVFYEFTL
jgi:hypothetical protein